MKATTIENSPYRSKLIDVARVVGALLIVGRHVDNYPEWTYAWSLNGRVGLFFLLAGYFCRFDLSYRKMAHKVIWLLIPFFLWNLITLGLGLGGLHDLSIKSLTGMGGSDMYPVDVPLWFLLSIAFYTLFVPLFRLLQSYRWIVLSLVVILDMSSGSLFSSIYLVKFFSGLTLFYLGLLLSSLSLPKLEQSLSEKHRDGVILLLGALLLLIPSISTGYVQTLVGIAMICAVSSLLLHYCRGLAHFLATYVAPAGFLIFALHDLLLWTVFSMPLFRDIKPLLFAVPFLCVAGISLLFYLMKRWAPWSLPLLAHRPPTMKRKATMMPTPRKDMVWSCLMVVATMTLLHVAPSRFSVSDPTQPVKGWEDVAVVCLSEKDFGEMKVVDRELMSEPIEVETSLTKKTTVQWTMQLDQPCVVKLYYCPASRQQLSYYWAEAIEFGKVSAPTPKVFTAELPPWLTKQMRVRLAIEATGKASF